MKPLFIIGYMASGKTTFGRALAKRLGLQFIDLDFYITQRFRRSIPEIFAQNGEEEFRRIEADILREVGEFSDVIISCGGGTPCIGDNMDYMQSRGETLFLDASVERICERVRLAPGKRPLLADKTPEELRAHIAGHLAERLPYYRRATITLPSDRLETRAQIADTLTRFLDAHPLI